MRRSLGIVSSIVMVMVLLLYVQPAFALGYYIKDLGTLGGDTSTAVAIKSGGICGNSLTVSGDQHAFLWVNYTMTDLGTLGGNFSEAVCMNSSYQVVGNSTTASGETHAFIWQAGAGMTDLGTLAYPYNVGSTASGINSSGQVVGWCDSVDMGPMAFIWDNGTMTVLDQYYLWGTAAAINDAGQVTGLSTQFHPAGAAYIWENGVMTGLQPLGEYGEGIDINESGQIIGTMDPYGFIWDNGVLTDLGAFVASGTWPTAINNYGQVTGYSSDWPSVRRAFFWENGVMTDLGTIGGAWSYGYDISDTGMVVGKSSNASGIYHAFAWKDGTMTDLGTLTGSGSSTAVATEGDLVVGQSNGHAVRWTTGEWTGVGIDFIPYDDTNSLDLPRVKKLEVVILSSATFDASTVDPSTVYLQSAGVAQKGNGGYIYGFEDVNGDGLADMVCRLNEEQFWAPIGVSSVTLQGFTYGLELILGEDMVNRTN